MQKLGILDQKNYPLIVSKLEVIKHSLLESEKHKTRFDVANHMLHHP